MSQSGRPDGFRGAWRLDAAARGAYAEAAGIARAMPRAVAVPIDADDVQTLVRWAHGMGAPLIPRGSGSSMAGGAIGDGVIVDLSRLAAIAPVDVAQRRVRVGPGVARAAVDDAARAVGLRFPPDPSSGAYCTVGGMAGTNAAGAHTLRFGAMRPWVLALECVFDDGSRALVRRGAPPPDDVPAIARFRRDVHARLQAPSDAPLAPPGLRKDSSGYAIAEYARSGELIDLLVGSEGTLALFTALELGLVRAPGATSSLLAAFATLEQAVAAAAAARDAGASACELLDRTFLDVAREGGHAGDVPPNTEGVLLAEVEADDATAAADAARVVERAFRAHGATTVQTAFDPAAEHAMWELRHAASPILARLAPSLASMQFIEDGAVPPDQLPAYVRGVRDALARRGMRGVIFGHAGDAHVHVNPLVDVALPHWRADVESLLDEVTELAVRLGGTLAGEHGDGRLRTPLLARTRSAEARARYALVKQAFDPAGTLNPGVKVPLPAQRALGDVKYDPALAPLPEASRRVLARVAAERAYGRSRLEMLEEESRDSGLGTRDRT